MIIRKKNLMRVSANDHLNYLYYDIYTTSEVTYAFTEKILDDYKNTPYDIDTST